jgi:hypothetical protein
MGILDNFESYIDIYLEEQVEDTEEERIKYMEENGI